MKLVRDGHSETDKMWCVLFRDTMWTKIDADRSKIVVHVSKTPDDPALHGRVGVPQQKYALVNRRLSLQTCPRCSHATVVIKTDCLLSIFLH